MNARTLVNLPVFLVHVYIIELSYLLNAYLVVRIIPGFIQQYEYVQEFAAFNSLFTVYDSSIRSMK